VRKFWYAGAVVAGGIILFGAASPAQADLLPGTGTAQQQADEQLANLLGSTNGATVENPLRYSTLGNTPLGAPPLVDYRAGTNGADLTPTLKGESAQDPRPDLPAADVVGGALRRPSNALQLNNTGGPQLPINNNTQLDGNPLRGIFGGFPLFGGGLLPDGGTPNAMRTTSINQSESFDGGLPLLGGLGGVLPVNGLPKAKPGNDVPDTAGMPAGGMAILPAAATLGQAPAMAGLPTGQPATGQTPAGQVPAGQTPAGQTPAGQTPGSAPTAGPTAPADEQPARDKDADQDQSAQGDKKPKPAATPDDPRLHEEPIDDEASTRRAFSADGRPVAGVDQQYK
jgi:hypothetical protein